MNFFSKRRADNLSQYNWLCNPVLANWIVDMLKVYGTSILDVGCGNGYMLNFYSDFFDKIAAIEPGDSFKDEIKEKIIGKDVIYKQAYAEEIPFEANSFEIVFAKSSLHHFFDIQQGLAEMRRVSKKVVAIMEVVAPSQECLPFLQNLLMRKEEGRDRTTVYTETSLKNTILKGSQSEQINQLLYDQYIDIETWLQYSDLSIPERKSLLDYILSIDSTTAKCMQLHQRGNRYMMLRRMCLCVAFI